jgi:hypothetical protein
MSFRPIVTAAVALVLGAAPSAAQSVLERTVGASPSGQPLEFRAFTTQEIGALAHAAGVPMGFEPLPPAAASQAPVRLSGRTLRSAIAVMLARDPRYEASEDDGVVLFRPASPPTAPMEWTDAVHGPSPFRPLDLPAPAVRLGETNGRTAIALVAALLGAPPTTDIAFGDTKTFVLDVPAGTTLSLLNAIVRAHGQLVWVFGPARDPQPMFPYSLMFMSGVHGAGLGLTGRPPEGGVDLDRFARAARPAGSVLDRAVGPARNTYPLVLTATGVSAVWDLSTATGVPMGIELAEGLPPARGPHEVVEFTATGRTLRDVLDALVARDPRYEWREMDGVVVMRPVRAWSDPNNPLFSVVADVQVDDQTMTEAARAVLISLGAADQTHMTFPDSKRVSLSAWHASAIELLNAFVRAHGSLAWAYQPGDRDQVRATDLAHQVTFYIAGGTGLGVPVR